MKLRKYFFYLLFISLTYYMLWIFDPMLGRIYDILTGQPKILTTQSIEQQLNTFEQIPFKQLPPELQERFSTDEKKVCYGKAKHSLYEDRIVYKIPWFQRYKFAVADYRFRDFMSGSEFFINTSGIPHLAKTQFLILDKKILLKILDLYLALQTGGYNPEEIGINSGFRTPFYNHAVGGKVCSRHQIGDAVDIYVYDINKDMEVNETDTKIVFDLLEKRIIKSTGGVGKYKSSSQVLHFDTRGFKARWYY